MLFGIAVETELDLPLQEGAPVDPVSVALGPVDLPAATPDYRDDQVRVYRGPCGEATIELPNSVVAIRRDKVTIDTASKLNTDLLVLSVWPLLLSLRGRESLHGCVVERGGVGIAVVGAQGSGKTTAALRLTERGFRLVADDLLVLDDELRAIPGPPFIRLRRDQAAGIKGEWDAGGKLRYRPPYCDCPVQLGRIIVLDEAFESPERLSGARAVDLLIRNLASGYLVQPRQTLNRFEFAAGIARRVSMFGAQPRSLSHSELLRLARPDD